MELRYFRDIEGREVDFVVPQDGKATLFVECKSADRDVSPALRDTRRPASLKSMRGRSVPPARGTTSRARASGLPPALELLKTLA